MRFRLISFKKPRHFAYFAKFRLSTFRATSRPVPFSLPPPKDSYPLAFMHGLLPSQMPHLKPLTTTYRESENYHKYWISRFSRQPTRENNSPHTHQEIGVHSCPFLVALRLIISRCSFASVAPIRPSRTFISSLISRGFMQFPGLSSFLQKARTRVTNPAFQGFTPLPNNPLVLH